MSDDLFDLDSPEEEKEDEAITYDGRYGFYMEDKLVVTTLIQAVRVVLKRDELLPQEIAQMAAFLYALERLPQVTEGISMEVRLVYEYNGERSWRQVRIDDCSCTLESGGYTYSPGIGGDSYSERIFEASAGGGREGNAFQASEFANMFQESATDDSYKLEIDEDLGTTFDQWDQEADEKLWSGLESDYC